MGNEVERKFLVKGDSWRVGAKGTLYRQGFLSTVKERTVRVRVAGEKAFLTVKGKSRGISRAEFEYDIPREDANAMLDSLCEQPIIEKVRYKIDVGGSLWEVDEFHGENAGLIMAEVELPDENAEFVKPEWIGDEVSDDARYYNANLVSNPFSKWGK